MKIVQRIAEWNVVKKIGEGATSAVFLVEKEGARFALKLLHEFLANDAASALRFRREAANTARISSKYIPKIVESGDFDGQPFYVMDFFEGDPLSDVLKARGKFPIHEVRQLAIELTAALVDVHRVSLVHRDIKPANILLDNKGQIRLIDFGFASVAKQENTGNEVAGTFLYSPPEQTGMLKRPVDGRSDLYSLGAVLFELAAGQVPFAFNDTQQLFHAHLVEIPRELDTIDASIDRAFSLMVARLLAKDPDDRYQLASSLLWDLQHIDFAAKDSSILGSKDLRDIRGATQTPFVGREKERNLLSKVAADVIGGNGEIVVLEGEGGVGKSRLAKEAKDLLQGNGENDVLVMSGKCQQNDAQPLGLIREIFDELLARIRRNTLKLSADQVVELIGENAVLFSRISRGLLRFLKLEKATERESVFEEQSVFYDRVSEFLVELVGRYQAGFFLIDDVQWIDNASLEIVQRVRAKSLKKNLFLMCTSRNDPSSKKALARFLEETKVPDDRRIRLDSLTQDEEKEMVASLLGGGTADPELFKFIVQRAKGNPFALEQYVRILLESGVLVPADGMWHLDHVRLGDVKIPDNVFQLVLGRVAEMAPGTLHVLEAAALSGQKFEMRFLAKAIDKLDVNIEFALKQAIEAQLVEVTDGSLGQFIFVHDRLVEALTRELSETRVKTLHDKMAMAMASVEDADQYVVPIARHFLRGHPEDHPEQTIAACLAAGKASLAGYGNDEAYGFLDSGLTLVNSTSAAGQLRLELTEHLATAATRVGRMEQARNLLEAAIPHATDKKVIGRFQFLIAEALYNAGKAVECWKYCEDALKYLGEPLPNSQVLRGVLLVWYWILAVLLTQTKLAFGIANEQQKARFILLHKIHELQAQITYILGDVALFTMLVSRQVILAHWCGRGKEYSNAHAWYSYLTGNFALGEATVFHSNLAIKNGVAIGDRFAEAYAELYSTVGLELLGDESRYPVQARHRELLPNVEKWCSPWEISAAVCAYVFNLAMLGHSRAVADFAIDYWNKHPQSDNASDTEKNRSRLMTSMALCTVSSQLSILGRPQESRKYQQEAQKVLADIGVTTWAHAFSYYNEVRSLMENDILGEQLERAIQGFYQVVYEKRFEEAFGRYGYAVIAEAYLERMRGQTGDKRLIEKKKFRRALALAEMRSWTPMVDGYTAALRAAYHIEEGAWILAERALCKSEALTEQSRSPAVKYLCFRERARLQLARGDVLGARGSLEKGQKIARLKT